MNYHKIYKDTFQQQTYSNMHHIQYDYVCNNIKNLNLDNNRIIEIGSGRGQNLIKLLENKNYIKNLNLTSVDLEQFHSVEINNFIDCDLSKEDDRNKLMLTQYDILVCTDVYEHLDKIFIEDVIIMCAKMAKYSILAIANHSDIINGIQLHTIQENDVWWENLICKYFTIINKEIHYNNQLYEYVLISKIQI